MYVELVEVADLVVMRFDTERTLLDDVGVGD